MHKPFESYIINLKTNVENDFIALYDPGARHGHIDGSVCLGYLGPAGG